MSEKPIYHTYRDAVPGSKLHTDRPIEKPLHVRVAEALGCKPVFVEARKNRHGEYWRCGCPQQQYGYPHNGVGVDGAPGEGGEIETYDTDWAVVGPLIERFRILTMPNRDEDLPRFEGEDPESRRWSAWWRDSKCDYRHDGPTPLIAACHMILDLKAAGKL